LGIKYRNIVGMSSVKQQSKAMAVDARGLHYMEYLPMTTMETTGYDLGEDLSKDGFHFALGVKVGYGVSWDPSRFSDKGKIPGESDIRIKFLDKRTWDLEKFELAMKEYGVESVDWRYVGKVMGRLWDKKSTFHVWMDRKYTACAYCPSFKWFVAEYVKFMFIDKCQLMLTLEALAQDEFEKIDKEASAWVDKFAYLVVHDLHDSRHVPIPSIIKIHAYMSPKQIEYAEFMQSWAQ